MSLLKKVIISVLGSSLILAADATNMATTSTIKSSLFGPLGAGLVVIGAGIGIGLLAFAAANAIARQPEAVKEIVSAVNLPLFLLEGVAIIGLVVCILAVVG